MYVVFFLLSFISHLRTLLCVCVCVCVFFLFCFVFFFFFLSIHGLFWSQLLRAGAVLGPEDTEISCIIRSC